MVEALGGVGVGDGVAQGGVVLWRSGVYMEARVATSRGNGRRLKQLRS